MPGAEEDSGETPSKRKRRQGRRDRFRTEDESYDDRAREPTAHQCTNWERALDSRRMPTSTSVPLLRKEVIQPHLPVRLPCYDFTPITDPTFDGSPPCGLGHRLRVLPTFVV